MCGDDSPAVRKLQAGPRRTAAEVNADAALQSRAASSYLALEGFFLNRMRTLTVRLIIFIFAAALSCAALAFVVSRRVLALAADKPLAQYSHSVWRTENGLPQNTVRAIAQTRDGYIWLATDDGLVRFDGMRFVIFDRQNTQAMKSSVILTLFEDDSGALWIGTDGGLLEYQNGKFAAYATKDGLANDRV